ncbi:outer membrane lipoprotein-sorting protein [Ginsengibacter hankyongi]|uniref:Outer membrane lipoprotein-sorting protein n=1 Tax=Ginsengibacter hankyongi TaxID=2607284 RepID=A0A5J5IJB0_9BACT|nr:outer membrane lipoprotein-sorting protein [Ginsengibacter hankyongi]KAA9040851.1 outer membrane lipoprotein-sorting protein [Ginsengibacter hankyongi]
MKKLQTCLMILVACVCSIHLHAQTVDEIINRNIEAMGGKEKLLALNSLSMEGTISIAGQKIPVKIIQLNDKGAKVTITMNGMDNYTIQTKDSGWNYFPLQGQTKPEMVPSAVIQETSDGMDIQGSFINYAEKGHTVELLGKEDVDGTECFKIRMVTKSGLEKILFIDPGNYYIIKTVEKTRASGQEQDQTQTFSNFKKMDNGYVFPFSRTGFGPGELEITKIEVNIPVDESVFTPSN